MTRRVVLSGCSGGGKSTLLLALAGIGHKVVAEPGRRIVAEERRGDGRALPWVDPAAFARRAMTVAREDWTAAGDLIGWVFFDRGLVDAASALAHVTGEDAMGPLGNNWRYHHQVFLTPPWPEIYKTDSERQHGFQEALAEYDRLLAAYSGLGYEIVLVPQRPAHERARFVLERLST